MYLVLKRLKSLSTESLTPISISEEESAPLKKYYEKLKSLIDKLDEVFILQRSMEIIEYDYYDKYYRMGYCHNIKDIQKYYNSNQFKIVTNVYTISVFSMSKNLTVVFDSHSRHSYMNGVLFYISTLPSDQEIDLVIRMRDKMQVSGVNLLLL